MYKIACRSSFRHCDRPGYLQARPVFSFFTGSTNLLGIFANKDFGIFCLWIFVFFDNFCAVGSKVSRQPINLSDALQLEAARCGANHILRFAHTIKFEVGQSINSFYCWCLWRCALTLISDHWPWTLALAVYAYRLWRHQTLYQILAKRTIRGSVYSDFMQYLT